MGEVISNSQFDYLWIQFYNNNGYGPDPCSLGLPGDAPFNYNNWTSFIATTPSKNAKLFVGVPANTLAANGNSGGAVYYASPSQLASIIADVKSSPDFGGIMMWDAGYSDANVNNGCNYAQEAKNILLTGAPCGGSSPPVSSSAPTSTAKTTKPASSSTSSASGTGPTGSGTVPQWGQAKSGTQYYAMLPPQINSTFHVHRGHSHLKWSKAIAPVLTVDSGDVVTFDTIDGSNGQVTPISTAEDVLKFKSELANPIFGPVYVRGAEPGDVLEVEVLKLKTSDWGWTAIIPGFGLLADDFKEPHLKIWKLDPDGSSAVFKDGIRIPTHPFLGVMGVAPEEGEFPTIPPLDTGGNIDTRQIIEGSKLYLPIKASGALFSCGDGHAAQGDGEVCGTAIETPMQVTLRLSIRKNMKWVTSPNYSATSSALTQAEDQGYYAVLGVDSDLLKAARKAVRGIIEYIVQTRNLTYTEAYMLASVSIGLRVSEVY
ncbi:hypothetical protein ACHAPV_001846 [Trichoderma viride]